METLDVIIPAWNEAPIIAETVKRTVSALSALLVDWTVTVVDNASTDGTAAAVPSGDGRVRVLAEQEPGKGNAVRSGILASEAELVLFMDADLSADLKHVGEFLDAMHDGGLDMIVGSRLLDFGSVRRSGLRTATSKLYNAAVRRALGITVRDSQCGFKMLRTATVAPIVKRTTEDGWFFDTELLMLAARAGLKIKELPIGWVEQAFSGRKSKLDVSRDSLKAIAMIKRLRDRRI